LANDFERVVGLDVSPELLNRARAVSPENVELCQVDGTTIPMDDGEVEAVFSVHVLMHLEHPRDVARYLKEAGRVLRADGSLMVHIPLASRQRPRHVRLAQSLRLWRSRRALSQGREHSVVRYRTYPPEDVHAMLEAAGFRNVELRVFAARSNGYHHAFWFGRAPA
jgi:ubiquinone/menaquinone biosynthesis C-methylase UbiE